MNKFWLATAMAMALLSGCGDGVPKVADPHKPLDANGDPIKGTEFLKKYCAGKPTNEDCARVQQAVGMDAAKGGLPKGW